MRMRAVLLASVAALALMGAPAQALPVLGFVQGVVAGLAGTALVGGTIATAGFLAGVAASTYVGGTFLGRLVLTVGLNAITAKLNRPRQPSPQERLVNLSQPLTYMQRCYGRGRKGGPVIFTGFANNARHYAVAIAAHRTKGPVAHWLDTTEVGLDGSGNVTTAPFTTFGRVRTYRGLPGQAVDALLDSTFPEVTAAYNFAGLSYAAIEAKKPPASKVSEVYPQGREWTYASVWDFHDAVFDPRTGLSAWTDNAALIIAHEAVFFGKTVDWAAVAIEANACDVLVANGDGGTQKKWTLSAILDDNMGWEAVRDSLGSACDAFFYETVDGKVGFYVGRYTAPAITLTDRDFLSRTIADTAWGPDVAGEAAVAYTEPLYDYQQNTSGAIVLQAGAPRLEDQLWAVSSHNQACRIANRQIRKARARYAIQGTIKLIGYELIGERFFRVQSTQPTLDVVFEVDSLIRNEDGLTFSLEATSVEPGDFDFVAATQEPARPARARVASTDTVPTITGLSGTAIAGTGGVAQIQWSWPAQDASLTQVFRGRKSGDAWVEVQIGEGLSSLISTGLIDGATYEGEVRNRTASGRVGSWSSTMTVTAIANSVAPGALTGFGVTVSGGTTGAVVFTAPNSPNYAAARIWRGTTNVFGSASLVRTEYGAPGFADGWNDTGLAPGTYYYWAAAINGSGIAGTLSGPQSITII